MHMILLVLLMGWMRGFLFDISSQSMFPLHFMRAGDLGGGDFNSDGLTDVLAGGDTNEKTFNLFLYRQNTSQAFYDITNTATFPEGVPLGFQFGHLLFVDVDRDGWLDFFYTGLIDFNVGTSTVYLQSDAVPSTFFRGNAVSFPAGLQDAYDSYADFADADGDGFLEMLLVGRFIKFYLYRQNASLTYTDVAGNVTFPAGLPPPSIPYAWTEWRDFDGDLLGDFVLAGGTYNAALFRQNTTLKFYNVWNAVSFPSYALVSAAIADGVWTDVDTNGRADFVLLTDAAPVCFFS